MSGAPSWAAIRARMKAQRELLLTSEARSIPVLRVHYPILTFPALQEAYAAQLDNREASNRIFGEMFDCIDDLLAIIDNLDPSPVPETIKARLSLVWSQDEIDPGRVTSGDAVAEDGGV